MEKPRVFVTRQILEKGLSLIRDFCRVDLWSEDIPPSRAALLEHVGDIDGLLCLLTDQIDGEVMDTAGPRLRVISNHAVGYDNIAVAEATRRGIPVGNTPGILTDATADFAFALMMAAARRVVEGERFVRDGKWRTWSPSLLLGMDIAGATLGLIGYGRIGKAVAHRATGFNMRTLYYDPYAQPDPSISATKVDLKTLLRESDFVSVHIPLTEETRHLINLPSLALMKQTAVLINTSRGQVVDQNALFQILKEKRIFAAALDVTDPEPLPMESPLLELDNLLIVPHIASASRSTREKMSLLAAENLIAGLKGERLPNCVNPEVYSNSKNPENKT